MFLSLSLKTACSLVFEVPWEEVVGADMVTPCRGVKRDPVAAKQYYETAANMGDTDAMNEVAWCYLEGFGCKKDKVRDSTASFVSAAQLHRLAVKSVAAHV